MESKNDNDVKLVLQDLLNEIRPLSEQLAMMLDEERSDDRTFRKQQLAAIVNKKNKIEEIFGIMDSIAEASSGGRRKTKRRRNKKKRKTKRKRRRRKK
jgi:hypothetical protein